MSVELEGIHERLREIRHELLQPAEGHKQRLMLEAEYDALFTRKRELLAQPLQDAYNALCAAKREAWAPLIMEKKVSPAVTVAIDSGMPVVEPAPKPAGLRARLTRSWSKKKRDI